MENHTAIESIRKQIEAHTTIREKVPTSVDLPLTHDCKRVLAYAAEEAEQLNQQHISPAHLLLGLMRQEQTFAARILTERGLRLQTIRQDIAHWAAAMNASTPASVSNLEIARQYLEAIIAGATGPALAAFFDSEMTYREYPNRLAPKGAGHRLPSLLDAAEKREKTWSSQSYTTLHEMAAGNQVIFEVLWEGTLAVPVESLPPGATLRAHIAIVLEFRNGKILTQRNYECFYPFGE